ncbi:MAG: hypothetical protein ACREC5_06115, partial [Thermoplasmata archaeon]
MARDRRGGLVIASHVGILAGLLVGLLLLSGLGAVSETPRGGLAPADPPGAASTATPSADPATVGFALNSSLGADASASLSFTVTLASASGLIDPGTSLNGTAELTAPTAVSLFLSAFGTSATMTIPPLGNFGPTTVPGLIYSYLGYSLSLSVRTFGSVRANSTGGAASSRPLNWSDSGTREFPVSAAAGAAAASRLVVGVTGLDYALSVGINASGTVPVLGAIDLPVVPFGPAGTGPGSPGQVLANYTVVPALSVLGFSAQPAPASPGATVTLTVSAEGGNPPLTFDYSNLPPGCLGANVSVLVCSVASAGNYRVSVHVSDSQEVERSANATIVVASGGGGSGTTG